MPEKNEEALVERERKRWLRSGDVARMDEDGRLFVENRIDDMIITGGENVYPREIEDVVYGLDGVVEVAVIGTPHDRLVKTITAVVVAENDLSGADVEAHCRERPTDYRVPRRVEFLDERSKTSTRKIDEVTLRDESGVASSSGRREEAGD